MKKAAHDPPAFVYIGRDITDQKQAEQAFMPSDKLSLPPKLSLIF
jgi:hypothetical protein